MTDVPEVLLCDTSYLGWSRRANAEPGRFAHWPADVLERIGHARLAITPMTIAEERYGWSVARWGAERVVRSQRLLRSLLLIPLDLSVVERYAHLRYQCRSLGLDFGYHDLWIAATAIDRRVTLVSCDSRQCSIPGLSALYLPPPV